MFLFFKVAHYHVMPIFVILFIDIDTICGQYIIVIGNVRKASFFIVLYIDRLISVTMQNSFLIRAVWVGFHEPFCRLRGITL